MRRKRADDKVKPLIREHLDAIGVAPENRLVDILKSVSDQFAATWAVNSLVTGVPIKRKMEIASLRALGHPYRRQLDRQNGRCAICGVKFDGTREEQLDHIVPWRLIGDVRDGSNWQILCFECNNGKRSLLTALLSPEAWGWLYATQSPRFPDLPTLETRYVVLAQRGTCDEPGCARDASVAELEVAKAVHSGLAVADNLLVKCDLHR